MQLFTLKTNNEDNIYTRKVNIPQYLPSSISPDIAELCNTSKYIELLRNINNSNVSDEDKAFLKLAATRHIVFNYAKIADYYAHASSELQELIEDSALVILDIDDAISKGYIKLSDSIRTIMNNSGVKPDER